MPFGIGSLVNLHVRFALATSTSDRLTICFGRAIFKLFPYKAGQTVSNIRRGIDCTFELSDIGRLTLAGSNTHDLILLRAREPDKNLRVMMSGEGP